MVQGMLRLSAFWFSIRLPAHAILARMPFHPAWVEGQDRTRNLLGERGQ